MNGDVSALTHVEHVLIAIAHTVDRDIGDPVAVCVPVDREAPVFGNTQPAFGEGDGRVAAFIGICGENRTIKDNSVPVLGPDNCFTQAQVAGGQYAIVNVRGRLEDPSEFGDVVIKSDNEGRIVRLSEVARIELGAYSARAGTGNVKGFAHFQAGEGEGAVRLRRTGEQYVLPRPIGRTVTGD